MLLKRIFNLDIKVYEKKYYIFAVLKNIII